MKLEGNISVFKSLTKEGDWTTDRGQIVYEDDEVAIVANGEPSWDTDFATIFKFITWVTFFLIKSIDKNTFRGALLHDLLWSARCELVGMYSIEFTNKILDNCLKHDGASPLKRWIVRVGVSSFVARNKWNNPSEEVRNFNCSPLTIEWK